MEFDSFLRVTFNFPKLSCPFLKITRHGVDMVMVGLVAGLVASLALFVIQRHANDALAQAAFSLSSSFIIFHTASLIGASEVSIFLDICVSRFVRGTSVRERLGYFNLLLSWG